MNSLIGYVLLVLRLQWIDVRGRPERTSAPDYLRHGRSELTSSRPCSVTSARRLRHLLHCLVDCERVRLLDRREVLEGGEELTRHGLGRIHKIGVMEHPLVVGVRCHGGVLERI